MRQVILTLFIFWFCISGKTEIFSLSNSPLKSQLDKDLWGQIDAWPKGEMTNGLFCAARVLQHSFELPNKKLSPPICYVYIANVTTNSYSFLYLPEDAVMLVTLSNSSGKEIPKIDESPKLDAWTEDKIKSWIERYRHTGRGVFRLPSLVYVGSEVFSICQTFQVKEAGEYTLHLNMRLVKSETDAAGKIYFKSLWLPEVTAKVQIRSEDIPQKKTPSSAATNSPSK